MKETFSLAKLPNTRYSWSKRIYCIRRKYVTGSRKRIKYIYYWSETQAMYVRLPVWTLRSRKL